jgi:flagellar hook protein FlgE
MFDSIQIGMSGMEGFSKGLKVISNNVANLNTPGFKTSTMQFTDAYYQQSTVAGGDTSAAAFGTGLSTPASLIDFHPGEAQQTDNPLDVSINGDGYLVAADKDTGERAYTRDGELQFDQDGKLVSTTTGHLVLGYDASGTLGAVTLDALRTNPSKATSTVKFSGNVNTGASTTGGAPDVKLDTVVVNDAVGASHTLKLDLLSLQTGQPDEWSVTISDGDTTVATGQISFIDGAPNPAENSVSFTYTPAGAKPFDVKFDFSANVTAYDTGNLSSLAVASQDGYGAGSITAMTFDADGHLDVTYSNGQTAKGSQLALAHFDSSASLQQLGHGEFVAADASAAHIGRPKDAGFGSIESSKLEMSNVDLSGEFSNLILMQRGYQAASNIVSTANEMLQELFAMHSGR